jgi:hypothetical protein
MAHVLHCVPLQSLYQCLDIRTAITSLVRQHEQAKKNFGEQNYARSNACGEDGEEHTWPVRKNRLNYHSNYSAQKRRSSWCKYFGQF